MSYCFDSFVSLIYTHVVFAFAKNTLTWINTLLFDVDYKHITYTYMHLLIVDVSTMTLMSNDEVHYMYAEIEVQAWVKLLVLVDWQGHWDIEYISTHYNKYTQFDETDIDRTKQTIIQYILLRLSNWRLHFYRFVFFLYKFGYAFGFCVLYKSK